MAVDGVALESKLVMMQANEGERRRREALVGEPRQHSLERNEVDRRHPGLQGGCGSGAVR